MIYETSAIAPRVSVCIPVYNGERYIGEAVESVLNQTKEDWELLVVDNNSSDHTVEIVRGYDDARLRVFVNPTNLGSLGNFNRCVELSRGKYFVLLPHDDLLMPRMLETFCRVLDSDTEIGMAYSSYRLINDAGLEIGTRIVSSTDKVMSSEEAISEFILHGNPVQCAMVRRRAFEELGSFDVGLLVMSDIDMWCRIALSGRKVAYCGSPQNCFRVRADSGQQSFLHLDDRRSEELSEHLGFEPSQDFVRQNSYYILAYRYLESLFDMIPESSSLQSWRPMAAKQWLLEPLVRHLFVSLRRGRWTWAGEDLLLLWKVTRWAGASGVVPLLARIPFDFVARRINRLK